MQYLIFLASVILIPMFLCMVDRRIKGARSVIFKLLSVVFVTGFILLGVYFYGGQILATFRINMKSFTSMKGFINSRLLIYFLVLMLIFLIACKFVFTVIIFKSENLVKVERVEKTLFYAMVVFDLALVPNIVFNHALFALFAATTIIEIGLVYIKLVFSIASKGNKEVLA